MLRSMTTNRNRETVATTETSLLILDLIKEQNEASLSQILDQIDLSKTTVHRHLATLNEQGYLSKHGERYRLGMKLWHLGNRAKNDSKVLELAERAVERLADQTQLESQFDVEADGQMISVFSRLGNDMEAAFEPGRCFCLHTTATGKAILAELPEARRAEIIEKRGLPSQTEHTITSKSVLEEELRDVRRRGYAINDEELRDGLLAVAGTIQYPDDHILGGISVGGPLYRIDREHLETGLAQPLISVIEDVERALTDVDLHM